jgi:PKD repeat protein
MKFTPLLLASFVVWAGSCDDAIAPKTQTPPPAPFVSFSSVPTCGPTNTGATPEPKIFSIAHACGNIVTLNVIIESTGVVEPATLLSTRTGQIEAQMKRWNDLLLLADPQYNLPRFNLTATNLPSAGLRTMTFDIRGGNELFCGDSNPGGGTIWGYSSGATKCLQSGTSQHARLMPDSKMSQLLFHELGHVLGFNHPPKEAHPELSNCVMVIPEDNGIPNDAEDDFNVTPCDYEKQTFYYYYGLRQTTPVINGFLKSFTITPGATTLTSRQSQAFTADVGSNHSVTWSVNHGSIVLANPASNPVTATAKVIAASRITKLTATLDDAPDVAFPFPTRYVPITIIPLPAVRITVTPASLTAGIGTSVVFKGKAYTEAPEELIPAKKFAWSVSGPAMISGSTTAASVTVVGTAAGTAILTATADGISRSATLIVIEPAVVDSIGVSPSGPAVLPGDTVIFTGDAWSQHTPRLAMPGVYFKWSVGAGAHIVGADSAPSVRVVADQPGSWIVTARTSGSVLGSTVLHVQAPVPVNNAPVARFSVSCQNLTCSIQNTSYDVDGLEPGAFWQFGDGTTSTVMHPVSHTYASAGTYVITLTATDQGGLSSDTSQTVVVSVPAEPINTSFTVTPEAGTARGFIYQAVSGYDNYAWSFGDGATVSGVSPMRYHTYASCGVYTVNLTITRAGESIAAPPQTVQVCPIE